MIRYYAVVSLTFWIKYILSEVVLHNIKVRSRQQQKLTGCLRIFYLGVIRNLWFSSKDYLIRCLYIEIF